MPNPRGFGRYYCQPYCHQIILFDRAKYEIAIIIMETEQVWQAVVDQPLRG
jgi:hypothetical protein